MNGVTQLQVFCANFEDDKYFMDYKYRKKTFLLLLARKLK